MKRSLLKNVAIIIVCFLFLSIIKIKAQTFAWAKSFGGVGEDMGMSIATDAAGNVYTTGYFSDTAMLDSATTLISYGMTDIFVTKHDSNGNLLWAKQMGGKQDDRGTGIAVSKDGYLYVLSTFKDTADLDPGTAVLNFNAGGLRDIGVCKLNASNSGLVWAKQVDGIGDDQGHSIKIDKQGNIIFTGIFYATPDFDPNSGTAGSLSIGWNDSFICKWDASGNFLWYNAWGGAGSDYAKDVAIDSANNIYVTGEFQYITDFDGGAGTNYLTPTGWLDAYLLKYRSNGTFAWAKQFGGNLAAKDTSLVRGESIEIDKQGNIFLLGRFRRKVDFNPGSGTDSLTPVGKHDVFLTKMDTSGTYYWTKKWGGPLGDDMPSRMAMDHLGNLYIIGYFYSAADFDPGNGTWNLYSLGSWDIFISAYRSNGTLIWAQSIGAGLFDTGTGITVDKQGNVYSTAGFQLMPDFDFTANTLFLSSNGANDVMVHKIGQTNVGINENNNDLLLNVYPNPVNNNLFITADPKFIGETFTINDITGRVVKTGTIQNIKTVLSVENLNAGIYFIQPNDSNTNKVIKFIKQ